MTTGTPPTPGPDGAVTSADHWYFFCFDERWRIVATFRGGDGDAKEVFVTHAARAGRAAPPTWQRDPSPRGGPAGAAMLPLAGQDGFFLMTWGRLGWLHFGARSAHRYGGWGWTHEHPCGCAGGGRGGASGGDLGGEWRGSCDRSQMEGRRGWSCGAGARGGLGSGRGREDSQTSRDTMRTIVEPVGSENASAEPSSAWSRRMRLPPLISILAAGVRR
jgi:hypothetical protein